MSREEGMSRFVQGLWTESDVREADLFARDLFGPPSVRRRRPRPRVEFGEDYGRDYFPQVSRPAGAPTGSAFAATWMSNTEPAGADWAARENAIAREITSGNVPSFV